MKAGRPHITQPRAALPRVVRGFFVSLNDLPYLRGATMAAKLDEWLKKNGWATFHVLLEIAIEGSVSISEEVTCMSEELREALKEYAESKDW